MFKESSSKYVTFQESPRKMNFHSVFKTLDIMFNECLANPYLGGTIRNHLTKIQGRVDLV
jgi:hypothetical protein